MKTSGSLENRQKKGVWHFENGKIFFSKTAEQRFFFTLTVIMLVIGIFYKFGLLH
jgi:hypothetical protein